MICPFCSKQNVEVVDTRTRDGGATIWRRRRCLSCNKRFSTREKIDFSYLQVTKKNGKKEPLSREKIVVGVMKSVGKKVLSEDQAEKLVDKIFIEVHKRGNPKITTNEIGNMVLLNLKKIDSVAYVRFASVFKNFENIKTFKKVLEGLDEI